MSILICYDGSPSSSHAIVVARRALAAEDVVLLHVWNPPDAFLADAFSDPGRLAEPPIERMEQLALEYANKTLSEGEALAAGQGLRPEARLARSDTSVWATILGVADEIDADVIVVGTRGRTAVQSALLGSVSGAVVHHSKRPVLVAPAGDA